MAKRIEFVDTAKGIAICLMVIGHSGYSGYLHQFIYAFHMPFFFLASGLFIKLSTKSTFKQNLVKSFKQLIIPYVAMYILTIPFGLAFIYFHGGLDLSFSNIAIKPIIGMLWGVDKIQGTYSIFSNGPLWFLLALFCARMLFYGNQLALNRLTWKWGGVLIGIVVSIGLFLVLQRLNINVWSLKQSLLLYPFLLIGFVSQYNYHIIDRIDVISRGMALLYSILLFVIVALAVPYLGIIDFGSLLMGDIPFVTYVVAIIGSIALLLFSRATQVFKELGKSTIVILGFHHPIMDVVKFCCLKAGINVFDYSLPVCLSISVVTIVLCYLVYMLMNRYTPFLIGKMR